MRQNSRNVKCFGLIVKLPPAKPGAYQLGASKALVTASKTELAEARQQLGIAEGKQVELKAVNEQQIGELSSLRQAQARQETELA